MTLGLSLLGAWFAYLAATALLLAFIYLTLELPVMDFIRNAAKAVTALIVSAATSLAAQYGLDLTEAQVSALTAALTTVLVFLVPNKTPEV